MTDIKIFVLHYTKLPDRKASILKQFQEQGITNFEFVELYDRDTLIPAQLQKFEETLSPSEMSLFLKHMYAYYQIASHYKEALILEDDVILPKNFLQTLDGYRQELSPDYHLLFLGDSSENEGQTLYERDVEHGITNKTNKPNIYMINKACARRFISHFAVVQETPAHQIDQWMNETARLLRPKVFWANSTPMTSF